jgi:hypothetical protein
LPNAFRRRAFVTTMIDDVDIATAAMSGVANPAMAIGTARTL